MGLETTDEREKCDIPLMERGHQNTGHISEVYKVKPPQAETMEDKAKEAAVAAKGEGDDGGGATWRAEWLAYSQSTTIHGICRITEDTPFTLRRLLWVCVTLAAVAMCGRQLVLSVGAFLDYPSNVNIKINYNNSIKFPAITVCNQNDFRTTALDRQGMYHNVRDYYNHLGNDSEGSGLHNTVFANISLDDLYSNTAHRMEDMLVECTWDEMPCLTEDLDTTVTDYGHCFTFNAGRNGSRVYNVSTTGADRGLRLLLNIEQYEYSRGPNPGAGIKLLIHSQNEVPLVRDLGQAVPPGSYAFVGLQMIEVDNLPPPHGVCNDSTVLQYFPHYSMSACMIECKMRYVMKECDCRDVYMPANETGYPPVCTLYQYNHCFLQEMKAFNGEDEICDCPVPCNRVMFDTSISYASTSNYDTDNLLKSSSTVKLGKRFVQAREVNQRVSERTVADDTALYTRFDDVVESVHQMFTNLRATVDGVNSTVTDYMERLQHRTWFHRRWGTEKVTYVMAHDFVRGWEVRKERTFVSLTTSYLEMVAYAERAIQMMVDPHMSEMQKRIFYETADSQFFAKLSAANRSIDNVTDVINAYSTSEPLLLYKASPSRRYDMYWITPDVVLQDRPALDQYGFGLLERLQRYADAIVNMRELLNKTLASRSVNWTVFSETESEFRASVRTLNYYMFQFEDKVVLRATEVGAAIEKKLENVVEDFTNSYRDYKEQIARLVDSLSDVDHEFQKILQCRNKAIEYLKNKSTTKTDLATFITSHEIEDVVNHLHTDFASLDSRFSAMATVAMSFEHVVSRVWETMLSEKSLDLFYQKLSEDVEQLKSGVEKDTLLYTFRYMLGKTESYVEENMDRLGELMNADFVNNSMELQEEENHKFFHEVEHDLGFEENVALYTLFFAVFSEVEESMRTFLQESRIDHTFYKDNFLQLDIFMRELSYEHIEQQEAYGVNSLWSDIGGTMGLFIGASVVSLVELADVIIHGMFKLYCKFDRKPSKVKSSLKQDIEKEAKNNSHKWL